MPRRIRVALVRAVENEKRIGCQSLFPGNPDRCNLGSKLLGDIEVSPVQTTFQSGLLLLAPVLEVGGLCRSADLVHRTGVVGRRGRIGPFLHVWNVLPCPGQVENRLCALLFDLRIKDAGVFVHRLPVEDGAQALLLQHHHVPLLRMDLVDGLLLFDVPLQSATTDKVPICVDLSTTGSVGQPLDHGGQVIGRRIAVADEKHLEGNRLFFLGKCCGLHEEK